MSYIVKRKHITEARFSVDGKRHERTLYFCGIKQIPCDIIVWDYNKRRAEIFTDKSDAQRFAYAYDGVVEEV
jgi:hypothetical protein